MPIRRPMYNHFTERVVQLMDGRTAPKILDIAAGGGEPSFSIARSLPEAHIVCTDLSDNMIAKAHERASELGLTNVECRVMDGEDMSSFPDGTFDCVTMSYGKFPHPWRDARPLLGILVYLRLGMGKPTPVGP